MTLEYTSEGDNMATTVRELNEWFDEGVKKGATHLIVVCDTFDWEDYPVYVEKGQDPQTVLDKYRGNMQKVMEVYNLSQPKDKQLDPKTRCWNL